MTDEAAALARQIAPRFVCTDAGAHKPRRLDFGSNRRPNHQRAIDPTADEFEGWQSIVQLEDGTEADAVVLRDPSTGDQPHRDRHRVVCPKCGRVYVLTRNPFEIWTAALVSGVSRIDLSLVL